jgi:mannose/fructose/N-acetylgalactosamine-specific phosphotransferase system component IIB
MNVVLVRVDNRLIHGQILEAWVPFLQAEGIVVADDGVASDFFRETVIRMAVPREIEVTVCSVDDLVKSVSGPQAEGPRTIVLFGDVGSAARARLGGFRFDRLNLGNIYSEECVLTCTPSVQLDRKELDAVLPLLRAGVVIDLKRVPTDSPPDLQSLLQKIPSGEKSRL